MTELKVVLDFFCSNCAQAVGITVQCAGKGLTAGLRTVAAVKVPCPHCHAINKVCFEPGGTVREVLPCFTLGLLPEPSLN